MISSLLYRSFYSEKGIYSEKIQVTSI